LDNQCDELVLRDVFGAGDEVLTIQVFEAQIVIEPVERVPKLEKGNDMWVCYLGERVKLGIESVCRARI